MITGAKQLSLFDDELITGSKQKAINVASVPQRSPFRYAGGKTWLIPTIRQWLYNGINQLIEPFCGGGIVSLTAAAENLADNVVMVEKDEEVAAVWEVIFTDSEWLADKILNFEMTIDNVNAILCQQSRDVKDMAFRTIIKNRTFHGGILAKGAGLIKLGEKGKGLKSRWYPETLARRIRNIAVYKDKITFINGDAFSLFRTNTYSTNTYFFIDPPYYVAGKRLYTYSEVDHDALFDYVSKLNCHYLMTYDKNEYILSLIQQHRLEYRTIPMQTTHLIKKEELIISDDFSWMK